jgi:hypothetical protein
VKLLEEMRYGGQTLFLDGFSQILIPETFKGSSVHFDLAFVDGNHDTDPTLADLRNVWPLTTRMVVHDIYPASVWSACVQWMIEQVPGSIRVTVPQGCGPEGVLFVERAS